MDAQAKISDKQTEILNRTSQSNKADLTLVSSQGDQRKMYRLEDLDEVDEKEPIAIGVINSGKTIAPSVEVSFLTSERFLGELRDKPSLNGWNRDWSIKELTSLNYTATFFLFKMNPTGGNLSVGEYNLTFSINCPYCEQTYKEENITICIYSDYTNSFKECGEKEKWKLH